MVKTERNRVDFAVEKYSRHIRNYIVVKHVAYSSTGSTSVLTVYMQLSRNKKRKARHLQIKRARNRITRFFIVLKFTLNSKTVTIRSFWQENGYCPLNNRCFNIYINILVIFCIIYGANVARNYSKVFFNLQMKKSHRSVRFSILWFNRSRSYQSKSVQYHHILTIEGEIALLSLYYKNCQTVHHQRTDRKKDLYASRAFYIT